MDITIFIFLQRKIENIIFVVVKWIVTVEVSPGWMPKLYEWIYN